MSHELPTQCPCCLYELDGDENTPLTKQIAIVWRWEDIKRIAEPLAERELSEQEYADILDRLKEHHDPNVGITWDVVRSAVADYLAGLVTP